MKNEDLHRLIKTGETTRMECKETAADSLEKADVSFLNAAGGHITHTDRNI
ncbi:MAG TPA: hypothetical protein O0X70_05530 [Methanocorpusculum sp.]|nr:hypothetical protein [Methanocorpusculum sp.]